MLSIPVAPKGNISNCNSCKLEYRIPTRPFQTSWGSRAAKTQSELGSCGKAQDLAEEILGQNVQCGKLEMRTCVSRRSPHVTASLYKMTAALQLVPASCPVPAGLPAEHAFLHFLKIKFWLNMRGDTCMCPSRHLRPRFREAMAVPVKAPLGFQLNSVNAGNFERSKGHSQVARSCACLSLWLSSMARLTAVITIIAVGLMAQKKRPGSDVFLERLSF